MMMRPMQWKLFEFFGIPVYVDLTFLILLFLFVNSGSSFSVGLMQAMVLGLSIIAHEYGHSLTGRAFGCETSHITLSFIGGCASMTSMPRRGWQEFLVAIAGPVVSFLLCGVGYLLLATQPIQNHFLIMTLVYLYWLNLVLGCFNLLPGFPMDGGRIFLLLVNTLFTAVTKKKIPAKYEAYIHAAGMVLLLSFMAFVTFKDIWKLFT